MAKPFMSGCLVRRMTILITLTTTYVSRNECCLSKQFWPNYWPKGMFISDLNRHVMRTRYWYINNHHISKDGYFFSNLFVSHHNAKTTPYNKCYGYIDTASYMALNIPFAIYASTGINKPLQGAKKCVVYHSLLHHSWLYIFAIVVIMCDMFW